MTVLLRICLFVSTALWLLSGCTFPDAPPPSKPQPSFSTRRPVTVVVDATRTVGVLPPVFRAGSFHWYLPDAATASAFDTFLAEQKVGTVAIKLDTVTEHSRSYEDIKKSLSLWDATVKKIVARGGEVLFEIWGMPLWLARNTSLKIDSSTSERKSVAFESPPRDYEEWARIVYAIVDHFNNGLKINAKYQVWAEPDGHFLGTEKEYLKLYLYSVKGARKADPKAKIGGPALSSWNNRLAREQSFPSDKPGVYHFIKYCSETPLPELGLSRLPIDFVVWHGYNLNPFSAGDHLTPASETRAWLQQFGYSGNTELLIGEWNSWLETGERNPYYSPEHDTAFAASYIVAELDAMYRFGIDSHVFSLLFDDQHPFEEYVGMFGMFTRNKIIKPSYNAFKAISMLGTTMVETQVDDDFLVAIGTAGKNKVALLISNFFPPQSHMHQEEVLSRKATSPPRFARHYTPEELKNARITEDVMRKLVTGEATAEGLGIPGEMRADVQALAKYLQDTLKSRREARHERFRTTEPMSVRVVIRGIPVQGTSLYQRFVIDNNHANSHAVRHKVEAALQRGERPERINSWPEVRLEPVESRNIEQHGEYRTEFTLEPFSVSLIIVSKK